MLLRGRQSQPGVLMRSQPGVLDSISTEESPARLFPRHSIIYFNAEPTE